MVSLIIPIYNVETYIHRSLTSAFNQTYTDIEFILVDDCGTDSSMSIAESLIQQPEYSNRIIKIIRHSSNKGLSAARNTGLEHAVGEYIFFMDSDDEISDNCIEIHVKSLGHSNADFSIANIQLVGAKSVHVKDISENILSMTPLQSFLQRKWNVSAWNKLYRKTFLQDNNLRFDDGLIHEDIIWSYRVAKCAKKIAVVNERTYCYKINNNSITRKPNTSKKLDSLLYILNVIMHDKFNTAYIRYYNRFIAYWTFNTSLLLLNYEGDFKSQNTYYKLLQSIVKSTGCNIYRCIMMLPYRAYLALVGPIYKIYKVSR